GLGLELRIAAEVAGQQQLDLEGVGARLRLQEGAPDHALVAAAQHAERDPGAGFDMIVEAVVDEGRRLEDLVLVLEQGQGRALALERRRLAEIEQLLQIVAIHLRADVDVENVGLARLARRRRLRERRRGPERGEREDTEQRGSAHGRPYGVATATVSPVATAR